MDRKWPFLLNNHRLVQYWTGHSFPCLRNPLVPWRRSSILHVIYLAISKCKYVYFHPVVSSVYNNFVYHNLFQYRTCPCLSLQLNMATYIDDERFHARGRADDLLGQTTGNRTDSNRDLNAEREMMKSVRAKKRFYKYRSIPCHCGNFRATSIEI